MLMLHFFYAKAAREHGTHDALGEATEDCNRDEIESQRSGDARLRRSPRW